MTDDRVLRRVVIGVALANLAYFVVEFAVARTISSVSLYADSIDFLEDASVNSLIACALGWSAIARARVGKLLAGVLLVPAAAAAWTAWVQLRAFTPPDPSLLSATGAGALVVNVGCALVLARHRRRGGSLMRAAWLSARNDAWANIAIVGAGALTRVWVSPWPDLVVGAGIALLNADAARSVWRAAMHERASLAR